MHRKFYQGAWKQGQRIEKLRQLKPSQSPLISQSKLRLCNWGMDFAGVQSELQTSQSSHKVEQKQ